MADEIEVYIPLDPEKRERARAICAEVARRLAVAFGNEDGRG